MQRMPPTQKPVLKRGGVMSRRVLVDALTLALLGLAERGERTHCSDPGTSELWISESVA